MMKLIGLFLIGLGSTFLNVDAHRPAPPPPPPRPTVH